MMQFNATTYQSLLVIAENYRLAKPPRIRMCLHCLMAVFNLNPPPQVQIRTHLQIGLLLVRYTENKQLAQSHLNAAMALSKSTGNELAYFEAVSILATTLCQLSKPSQAKPILRGGISASQHNAYWHARLLLQLAHIHHEEGDHASTQQLLDVGAELASNCGSDYLKILFLLSKGMVLLVQQKLDEVNVVLSMCGQLIDGIKNASPIEVESHKVYFLTLQVAHLLQGGQVKSVKSSLKQLQQSIQEITALPASACSLVPVENTGHIKELHEVDDMMKALTSTDAFSWLPRDHMCILVYLVTVTHSLLAGFLDKAQKYTEKALKQIQKLKATDHSSLLVQLELMFLEHSAQCHLIMCDKKKALQKITEGCRLCVTYPNTLSITRHTTQMHTLLGMYCMSMNFMDDAEKHLQIAMKRSLNNEQLATNMLNLAMVYMHNYQLSNGRISPMKQQELVQILSQINPDSVALKSRNLKAASYFVKGMFAFFQSIHSDAKRFLRETLKMANAQDLNRLTACALVLLGHIYLTISNNQESVNMVLPAMQLATKIPDTSVKLWASALLRDLYRLCGDEEHFNEYKNTYEKLASQLLSEQHSIGESSQQELIKWFSDDLPPVKTVDVTEVTNEDTNELSTPMEIGTNMSTGWPDESGSSTGASVLVNDLQPNSIPESAIRQTMHEVPPALSMNMDPGPIAQNVGSSAMRPGASIHPNTYYQQNMKSDAVSHPEQRSETLRKFHTPPVVMAASAQSHLNQMMPALHESSLKQPHQSLYSNALGENSNMALATQELHNQMHLRTLLDSAPSHAHPVQQNNPFVPPHHSQMSDALETTQSANVAKGLVSDPAYLISGAMRGLSSSFTDAMQHHPQLQALQQMQAGHAPDLQHMYNSSGFFTQQNVGYPANTKAQMERQQQSWVTNQNHIYNINSGNYAWR